MDVITNAFIAVPPKTYLYIVYIAGLPFREKYLFDCWLRAMTQQLVTACYLREDTNQIKLEVNANKKAAKKADCSFFNFGIFGEPSGTRTQDHLLKREMLCRLS
jgi:hypothetical protein